MIGKTFSYIFILMKNPKYKRRFTKSSCYLFRRLIPCTDNHKFKSVTSDFTSVHRYKIRIIVIFITYVSPSRTKNFIVHPKKSLPCLSSSVSFLSITQSKILFNTIKQILRFMKNNIINWKCVTAFSWLQYYMICIQRKRTSFIPWIPYLVNSIEGV